MMVSLCGYKNIIRASVYQMMSVCIHVIPLELVPLVLCFTSTVLHITLHSLTQLTIMVSRSTWLSGYTEIKIIVNN